MSDRLSKTVFPLVIIVLFTTLTFFVFKIKNLTIKTSKSFTPVYQYDWFSQNIEKWENLLKNYKGKPAVNYLEVGVAEGRSAFWMLENILTHSTSRATLVDPFFPKYRNAFFSNLEKFPYKKKAIVKEGYSQRILRDLPLNNYDIIYIDGSHAGKNVYIDIALSWGLLKENGILILDDHFWKSDTLPVQWRPELSINTFLTIFSDDLVVLNLESSEEQKWIRKISAPSNSFEYSRVKNCYFDWHSNMLFNKDEQKVEAPLNTVEYLVEVMRSNPDAHARLESIKSRLPDFPILSKCFE